MPKKKNEMPQEEQSKRFVKAAKDLLRGGKQNRTEVEQKFERTVESIASSTASSVPKPNDS